MTPSEIKALRKQAGLSVTEAARCVHVTDRTWQRYEQGTRHIPEAVVELFCRKYEISYPPDLKKG